MRLVVVVWLVVVVLAMLFALTFLPALLAVLGPRIHAGALPIKQFGPKAGFWHRAALWVMRRPILNNSAPGQPVYEPFSGSGTTLIAAETTGRVCLAVELDPAYVDVAVARWQAQRAC